VLTGLQAPVSGAAYLGVTLAPADIRALQGQGMRVTMKPATKNILKQHIKEHRTLN
jgi:hypothetical protein